MIVLHIKSSITHHESSQESFQILFHQSLSRTWAQNPCHFSSNVDIIFTIFIWFSSKVDSFLIQFSMFNLQKSMWNWFRHFLMWFHTLFACSLAYLSRNRRQSISLSHKHTLTMIFYLLLSFIFYFSLSYFSPKIHLKFILNLTSISFNSSL